MREKVRVSESESELERMRTSECASANRLRTDPQDPHSPHLHISIARGIEECRKMEAKEVELIPLEIAFEIEIELKA